MNNEIIGRMKKEPEVITTAKRCKLEYLSHIINAYPTMLRFDETYSTGKSTTISNNSQ